MTCLPSARAKSGLRMRAAQSWSSTGTKLSGSPLRSERCTEQDAARPFVQRDRGVSQRYPAARRGASTARLGLETREANMARKDQVLKPSAAEAYYDRFGEK